MSDLSEHDSTFEANLRQEKLLRTSGNSLMLRGVVIALFGLLMLLNPAGTTRLLMLVLGAILMVDGIALLGSAAQVPSGHWVRIAFLLPGFLLLCFGLVCIFYGAQMLTLLTVLVGIWLLLTGIQELTSGVRQGFGACIPALLSLLIGILLITSPWTNLNRLVWLVGLMIMISGIASFWLGLKLRLIR